MDEIKEKRRNERHEQNCSAQKRSRSKKKAEWETLCEEVERLKMENVALKLERHVNRKYFYTSMFKAVEQVMVHVLSQAAVEPDYIGLGYKVQDYADTLMEHRFLRSYYAYAVPSFSARFDPDLGEIPADMIPLLEEFHGELGQHKAVLEHLHSCSQESISEIRALEDYCRRIVGIYHSRAEPRWTRVGRIAAPFACALSRRE